jgi:hypothetical protein
MRLLLNYLNGKDLFTMYFNRLKLKDHDLQAHNHEELTKQKEMMLDYWHPIIDLFLYSIRNYDRVLEENICQSYIYKVFGIIKFTENIENDNVTFPNKLYNSSYDIIYTYIKCNEGDYYQYFEQFIGSIYFPNSFEKNQQNYLNQETLKAIWRNLVLLIENKRGDKILKYWERAHQYLSYQLEVPRIEYDDKFNKIKESVTKNKNILRYREIFIQFHTVLGAYLMYKQDYKALKETWFFTQSQPPTYVLIPQSVELIFNYVFLNLNADYHNDDMSSIFWFRGLNFEEMNYKNDVKSVVRDYMGLLFLRLYLVNGIYGNHPLSTFPQIPEDQSKKIIWEQNLDIFKSIVEKHLANKVLLKSLGLDKINDQLCLNKKIKCPLDYIDKLNAKIKEEFQHTLETSPLEPEKINNLNTKTVEAITKTYKDIYRIHGVDIYRGNEDEISKELDVIRGKSILINRESFISNSHTDYYNADSIMGDAIENQYYYDFALKVSLQKKKCKYTVASGQMFKVIDKLNLNPDDYIILSFGFNLEYQRDYNNVPIEDSLGEEDYRYNSIPIYCYNFAYSPVFEIIYLINRKYLPMIKHKDWLEIIDLPETTKAYWGNMDLIDHDLKIYQKISEINSNKSLIDEYVEKGKTKEELRDMLEITIDFLGYCWFTKETEIIEIKENELFQEGGIIDDIDDIKPLN